MTLHDDVVVGGAERFLRLLVEGLAPHWTFDVVCRVGSTTQDTAYTRYFPIVEQNVVDRAQLTTLLGRAQLLWCFDRHLEPPPGLPSVLTLGSLEYGFCRAALERGRWTVVAPMSASLQNDAQAEYSYAGPFSTIPPAIDPVFSGRVTRRSRTAGPLEFAVLHRPDPRKGHRESLELIAALHRAGTAARLTCPIPDGDPNAMWFREVLEAEAMSLGISSFVRFVPWYSGSRLLRALDGFDATLHLGTMREGFGLSYIESIARACPVLSTGAGHLRMLLPDRCGVCLVPVGGSLDAQVSAILGFLRAPTLGEQLERGRRTILRRYSLVRSLRAYHALLSRTLRNA